MDTNDEVQKLQALVQKHNKIFTWVIIIAVLAVLVLVFIKFWGDNNKTSFADDKVVKAMSDSIRIHDQQRLAQYQQLQQQHTRDSIQIADIQGQLDDTQNMIDRINTKYDKIRNNLAHSTTDTKMQFLTGHLPKGGTSR